MKTIIKAFAIAVVGSTVGLMAISAAPAEVGPKGPRGSAVSGMDLGSGR